METGNGVVGNCNRKEPVLKELTSNVRNLNLQIAELTSKLDEERDENAALSKTLSEQQRLIRAAIDRISPPSSVDGVKICEEHQDFLDKYLRKLRGEKTDLEHKAAG